MAQQQAYQNNQSVIMEQMKNMMQTSGKENENGQTQNAHAQQGG